MIRLMSQNASDSPGYMNIPGHPTNNYGEMLASTFPNTRLIVMDNGLGILTNAEEEQINFVVSRTTSFYQVFVLVWANKLHKNWSLKLIKTSKHTVCPQSHYIL